MGFWTVDGSERGNSAGLLFSNYNVTLKTTHYTLIIVKKRMINMETSQKSINLSCALKSNTCNKTINVPSVLSSLV